MSISFNSHNAFTPELEEIFINISQSPKKNIDNNNKSIQITSLSKEIIDQLSLTQSMRDDSPIQFKIIDISELKSEIESSASDLIKISKQIDCNPETQNGICKHLEYIKEKISIKNHSFIVLNEIKEHLNILSHLISDVYSKKLFISTKNQTSIILEQIEFLMAILWKHSNNSDEIIDYFSKFLNIRISLSISDQNENFESIKESIFYLKNQLFQKYRLCIKQQGSIFSGKASAFVPIRMINSTIE